jgi:hypothetical protein
LRPAVLDSVAVPEIVCFSGSVAGKTIVPPDYFTAAQADSQKTSREVSRRVFMSGTGHLFRATTDGQKEKERCIFMQRPSRGRSR